MERQSLCFQRQRAIRRDVSAGAFVPVAPEPLYRPADQEVLAARQELAEGYRSVIRRDVTETGVGT
jgi:hypothetical protein